MFPACRHGTSRARARAAGATAPNPEPRSLMDAWQLVASTPTSIACSIVSLPLCPARLDLLHYEPAGGYCVIVESRRARAWVLSRDAELPPRAIFDCVRRLRAAGFDADRLRFGRDAKLRH